MADYGKYDPNKWDLDSKYKYTKEPTTYTAEELRLKELQAYKQGYREGYRDGQADA